MKRIFMVGYSKNKGGVEVYISNLCSKLPKEKYEIIYDWQTMKIDGKTWIRPRNRHNYIAYRRFWKKFFQENKFDVLYYNTCDIVSIDMLKFAKKAGVPIRIIHSHSTGNQMGVNRKIHIIHKMTEQLNRKNIENYATFLLACSESAGEWMFGGHSYKIIHNGINLDAFKYEEKIGENIREKNDMSNAKVIGYIGRLSAEKNPLYAEKIAESVLKKDPQTKFVFIGDGELADEVKNIVKNHKLEKQILFMGAVDNVNEWMSALDCLIMPSLFEGLPFVLVEAQAAGLPCVVSSTVSREADFTGLLQFIDLDAGEDVWAKTALDASERKREDYLKDLIAAGYSIENTAKEVREIIEGVEK